MALTVLGTRVADESYGVGGLCRRNASGVWTLLGTPQPANDGPWHLRSFNIPSYGMYLFYIDAPATWGTLSRSGGALMRSTDLGTTWTDVTPSASPDVYAFGIDMAPDGTLWLIVDEEQDEYHVDCHSHIYKSTDGGGSWSLSHTVDLIAFGIRARTFNVAADPSNSQNIVVEGRGVPFSYRSVFWVSTDGGSSWSYISTPTAPILMKNNGGQSHLFGFDQAGTNLIYSPGSIPNTAYYVLYSTDRGSTWTIYLGPVETAPLSPAVFRGAGILYFLHDPHLRSAPDLGTAPTVIADESVSPFLTTQRFNSLDLASGYIALGLAGNSPVIELSPAWRRRVDLSDGWTDMSDTMVADMGFQVWPRMQGLLDVWVPAPVAASSYAWVD